MPWSSNGTYLVEVCLAGETMRAVYKPVRGERPLWDFEGMAIPDNLVSDLARLAVSLPDELSALLDSDECEALAARAAAIVKRPVFPSARSARPYPWPLV